jgi:LmbE family N-acetylglucosaminyl deacetylase
MDAAGVDETRFKELRQKLTSSELQEKEHNKLMEEYEQQAKALRKAQSQTVNDQEIQATREKLFQKTIQAMKEVDPKSEEMFNSLKSTRKRLMDLQKQWMSSQEAKTHNE